jgi:hypothetical protein
MKMGAKKSNSPPTWVPIVRGAKPRPIIDLEMEYEDEAAEESGEEATRKNKDVIVLIPDQIVEFVEVQIPNDKLPDSRKQRPTAAKNGKPKVTRSKTRKKKPAKRGKP